MYQRLRKMSKKFQKDISSGTGYFPLSKFGKEVSKQTDLETYKKFRIIWKKCTNITGMPPKILERDLIQTLRYPYIYLISVRKLAN